MNRRWVCHRVTRANAGGDLYNAVNVQTGQECDEGPSHDRAAIQRRVDRLNSDPAPTWTPELFRELQDAALSLVLYPPATWSRFGFLANVPRARVDRVRAIFEKAGIDWRKLKRAQKILDNAARFPTTHDRSNT